MLSAFVQQCWKHSYIYIHNSGVNTLVNTAVASTYFSTSSYVAFCS